METAVASHSSHVQERKLTTQSIQEEQAERMRLEKYKPQHLKMTVAGQCIELARLDRQREEQELRERERWTKILA